MKAHALLSWLAAGTLLVSSAPGVSAAWRRVSTTRPPANNRAPAAPKPIPDPTKKFKEIAVNSQFYMATDLDQLFLKIKVSATASKTVKTGEILGPIPEDTLVIPAKAAPKTAAKAKN